MSTGASSLASPATLVGLLWPSREDPRFTALRAVVLMVARDGPSDDLRQGAGAVPIRFR